MVHDLRTEGRNSDLEGSEAVFTSEKHHLLWILVCPEQLISALVKVKWMTVPCRLFED